MPIASAPSQKMSGASCRSMMLSAFCFPIVPAFPHLIVPRLERRHNLKHCVWASDPPRVSPEHTPFELGRPRAKRVGLGPTLDRVPPGRDPLQGITEAEAYNLSALLEARRAAPVPLRRRAIERRRSWAARGLLPPHLAARFTIGEAAAVVARETIKAGACMLALDHLAALSGTSRSTVKRAIREAESASPAPDRGAEALRLAQPASPDHRRLGRVERVAATSLVPREVAFPSAGATS
jgi:hypothetical protein